MENEGRSMALRTLRPLYVWSWVAVVDLAWFECMKDRACSHLHSMSNICSNLTLLVLIGTGDDALLSINGFTVGICRRIESNRH